MLNKECAVGMYKFSAYLARMTSDLPLDIFLPVVFMVIVYYMASLKASAMLLSKRVDHLSQHHCCLGMAIKTGSMVQSMPIAISRIVVYKLSKQIYEVVYNLSYCCVLSMPPLKPH